MRLFRRHGLKEESEGQGAFASERVLEVSAIGPIKRAETRTPPVVPQPVPPFNPGEGGYLSAVECDPADDCGTHHVTWVSVALDAELGWGVTSFDLGLTPPVVPQPEGERW